MLRWDSSTNVEAVAYDVFRSGRLVARVAATTASEQGLRAGAEYCYSVRAVDEAGDQSTPVGPVCAKPLDLPVPSDITVGAASDHEVIVTWNTVSDDTAVTGYEVFREEALVADVAKGIATESGLEPGTEYCYAVRARDAVGNRSGTSARVCVTTPDTIPPTTPGDAVASAISDREIELRWKESMDNVAVAGYEVYRTAPGHGMAGSDWLVTQTLRPPARESNLQSGKKYCYLIVAYDPAGNRSPPAGPLCVTLPDVTPPTIPEAIVAAPASSTEVLLAWSPSTDDVGVAGYELLRGGKVIPGIHDTSATDRKLTPLMMYCYAVRAYDAAGNRSKPSVSVCVKTPDRSAPERPTRLRAEAVVAREIVLAWMKSPTPTVTYAIDWERNGWRRIGTTSRTHFRVFGPVARERHCYRISGFDAAGRELSKLPEICMRAGDAPLADESASAAAR